MSTTIADPFFTADRNRSIQQQGFSQGQLEVISPLEIKDAQVSTAAASEAARRPQRPPDQAGQRPESSAPATSSKRAHPEGNYFVNKDAPREAFLRRKLARTIEVHHDNSERIAAVRASYSADEIRQPPQLVQAPLVPIYGSASGVASPAPSPGVFPRAIETTAAEDLVEPRKEPAATANKFAFKDSLISSIIPQLPIPAPPTRQLAAARTRPSTPVPLSEPDDDDLLDEPCTSCEAEEGKLDSIGDKEIGDIRYSQMGGKDELRMIPVLDMRRPSIFSNPFSMGKDEAKRDLVCDAYQEWWRCRTVTVDEICAQFGATRAQTWHGDEIAASEERIRGLSQLARIVSKGHKIAAGCACPATRRCHTQVIRSMVLEEARLLRSRESVAEPVKQVVNDKYLVLFAGDKSVAGRLSEQIRLKDSDALVEEYDIRNDSHQDLSDVELQLKILGRILDGEFRAVHIAPPIGSYAVVDGPQIRSLAKPRGLSGLSAKLGDYLLQHNRLSDFAALAASTADKAGIPWSILSSAELGVEASPAFSPEYADWAQLWHQPAIINLIEAGARKVLVPLCMCGSPTGLHVEVLMSATSPRLLPREGLECDHVLHEQLELQPDARGDHHLPKASFIPIGLNVLLARAMVGEHRRRGPTEKSSKTSSSSLGNMHVGSARPHAIDGAYADQLPTPRIHKLGSLRCLEPELDSVLLVEALPRSNVPRRTEADEPPPQLKDPPGPFTTAQLIPAAVQEQVQKFAKEVAEALRRAGSGPDGWRVARKLRPTPVAFSEAEALNECGWGFAWRRRDAQAPLTQEALWDAIRPSSYPHDQPCAGQPNLISAEHFTELADAENFPDKQVVSWVQHGFPGVGMPNGAVLAPPHVGALKEAQAFDEQNVKNIKLGFISPACSFPEFWPVIIDPCNIVVQNGKPRLTIDKSMWTSGRADLPPFNTLVNLAEEAKTAGSLSLVTVREVARAAAILGAPLRMCRSVALPALDIKLKMKKFDLKAFFRFHPKQRLAWRESGLLFKDGYSVDMRPNFGEAHAPDHTCRESDGVNFFTQRELARMDKEYPSTVPPLISWLASRAHLRARSATSDEFLWDVLFWMCYYVDDGGLLTFDDKLYDSSGAPKIILIADAAGVTTRHHQTRIELYAEAAIKIALYLLHECPADKQDGPDERIVFLGIGLHLDIQRRLLPKIKAQAYASIVKRTLETKRVMPNGVGAAEFNQTHSLIHKLLHASDVIPLGRPHLFHLRQAVNTAKKIFLGVDKGELLGVMITAKVRKELIWWQHQLETADLTGLPLASRSEFPGISSPTHLIRYSDASRELDLAENHSGAGAWCAFDNTFYYIHWRWSRAEIENFSINVLEAHARDVGGKVFLDLGIELGKNFTHTTAFVDNTTAESIAENGRTSTEMLNELNLIRLRDLMARKVHEKNERIASVDNDVADDLSRGAIREALRFPSECGMRCVELQVPVDYRELPSL
jgi:hypothetical protein